MAKKSDADAIRQFLSELPSTAGLDDARRWWPKYVYRSDHVENAARILESGYLLSRAAAENENVVAIDAASPAHIAQMAPGDRDLVRLYFRPRTPTQYCNEGVRPRPCIEYGAHMPVPVYFLFDAVEILTEKGVTFSRGRLVPNATRGGSASFLKSLDFLKVYHSTGVGQPGEKPDRGEILNARHSEVLVPGRLPLEHLRFVICRSAPERDTLLNLLSPVARGRWQKRIVLEGSRLVFFKRATFVAEAALGLDGARLSFFVQTLGPEWRGPFAVEAFWEDGHGGLTHGTTIPDFWAGAVPLALDVPAHLPEYVLRVSLDGNLAFVGKFTEAAGPSVL